MKRLPDLRERMLDRLPSIELGRDDRSEAGVRDETSLARALVTLAGLKHDEEYARCRALAQHLLGHVPEPDEIEIE